MWRALSDASNAKSGVWVGSVVERLDFYFQLCLSRKLRFGGVGFGMHGEESSRPDCAQGKAEQDLPGGAWLMRESVGECDSANSDCEKDEEGRKGEKSSACDAACERQQYPKQRYAARRGREGHLREGVRTGRVLENILGNRTGKTSGDCRTMVLTRESSAIKLGRWMIRRTCFRGKRKSRFERMQK